MKGLSTTVSDTNYLNEGLWLLFVIAGSYLSAAVAESTHPWVVGATLAGILVFVPWTNPWETRQRGLAHQVLLKVSYQSLASPAGYMFFDFDRLLGDVIRESARRKSRRAFIRSS